MRQLLIQVPRGQGQTVLDIARQHQAVNVAMFEATGIDDGPIDTVILHVSNSSVEGVLQALDDLPEVHLTLLPRGVIALKPPASQAPEQTTNVEPRSPIEIFLAGLQSIGSWKGFLGYAAVAGIVVWIGLFTNTVYLLVAAMLIAPFAGPAMNFAIASASGDGHLLVRSLLRYFAALAVTVAVCAALTLLLRQNLATETMVAVSELSSVSVLLPLATGAAGALNLVQSERTSLVSGAAIGVLVSASLAPPAGVVGMSAVLGLWDMALRALFILLLQLAGINLLGAVVFRLYGLTPRGPRFKRGQRWVFGAALAGTLAALAALLIVQFADPVELERSSRAQRAAQAVQEVVRENDLAYLVEINARFPRTNIAGQNTLLSTVYVQRRPGVDVPVDAVREQLRRAVEERLVEAFPNVTPLVSVEVLEAP